MIGVVIGVVIGETDRFVSSKEPKARESVFTVECTPNFPMWIQNNSELPVLAKVATLRIAVCARKKDIKVVRVGVIPTNNPKVGR